MCWRTRRRCPYCGSVVYLSVTLFLLLANSSPANCTLADSINDVRKRDTECCFRSQRPQCAHAPCRNASAHTCARPSQTNPLLPRHSPNLAYRLVATRNIFDVPNYVQYRQSAPSHSSRSKSSCLWYRGVILSPRTSMSRVRRNPWDFRTQPSTPSSLESSDK